MKSKSFPLPAEEQRRMMRRLYRQFDHVLLEWKETLQEVERIGAAFWEVHEFQRIPGVGPMAAHVFSAIIEEPERFANKHKLWKYSQLGITDRTSDNKPLGYQRLDRRGNPELKNLSYHAWRTACKSTTGPNAIKAFYQRSRQRTGSVRSLQKLRSTPTRRSTSNPGRQKCPAQGTGGATHFFLD